MNKHAQKRSFDWTALWATILMLLYFGMAAFAAGPPYQEVGQALYMAGRVSTHAKARPVNLPGEVTRAFNPDVNWSFLPGQFARRWGLGTDEAIPLARCYVGGHSGNPHSNAILQDQTYVVILQAMGLLTTRSPDINPNRDTADILWTCSREWLYANGVRLGLIIEPVASHPPPAPAPVPAPAPAPPPPVRTDFCRRAEMYLPTVMSTGRISLVLTLGPEEPCPSK